MSSSSSGNSFGQQIALRNDAPLPPSIVQAAPLPGPSPEGGDFTGGQMPFLHGGLSFNLQNVTSESVAALAQQATMMAAQLRELESRAALSSLAAGRPLLAAPMPAEAPSPVRPEMPPRPDATASYAAHSAMVGAAAVLMQGNGLQGSASKNGSGGMQGNGGNHPSSSMHGHASMHGTASMQGGGGMHGNEGIPMGGMGNTGGNTGWNMASVPWQVSGGMQGSG
eukprot:CAMPEP_0180222268 /NCGR_PEP_ID=MMETSP0987-20121128/20581_1 /TAXON_ID=697907 /ORGANISM="non described non described, Strain CCMP2293" /LENGTH=223 /DNA_ID=CAMNT_0022184267 /DNA_START=113 /DNA_END=781 /DNA_ORIENTATION=+